MKYLILAISFLLAFSAQADKIVSGQGTINYVVDGDTFDVRLPYQQRQALLDVGYVSSEHVSDRYQTFRVRLANVNTAESAHVDKSRNTKAGKQISNYVQSIVLKQEVEYHCFEKGNHGRAICSLNIEGLGDLGLHLIQEDLSPYVVRFGKHPTMHQEYQRAATQ